MQDSDADNHFGLAPPSPTHTHSYPYPDTDTDTYAHSHPKPDAGGLVGNVATRLPVGTG